MLIGLPIQQVTVTRPLIKTPNKTSKDSDGTAVSHVVSGVNYIVSNDTVAKRTQYKQALTPVTETGQSEVQYL